MSDTSSTEQPTEPEAPVETLAAPEPTPTPAPAAQTTGSVPTWPVIPPTPPHGYEQDTGAFIS